MKKHNMSDSIRMIKLNRNTLYCRVELNRGKNRPTEFIYKVCFKKVENTKKKDPRAEKKIFSK